MTFLGAFRLLVRRGWDRDPDRKNCCRLWSFALCCLLYGSVKDFRVVGEEDVFRKTSGQRVHRIALRFPRLRTGSWGKSTTGEGGD